MVIRADLADDETADYEANRYKQNQHDRRSPHDSESKCGSCVYLRILVFVRHDCLYESKDRLDLLKEYVFCPGEACDNESV